MTRDIRTENCTVEHLRGVRDVEDVPESRYSERNQVTYSYTTFGSGLFREHGKTFSWERGDGEGTLVRTHSDDLLLTTRFETVEWGQ